MEYLKPGVVIQSYFFDRKYFSKDDSKWYLKSRNYDPSTLKEKTDGYYIELIKEDNLMPGSIRHIIMDGFSFKLGMLKNNIAKSSSGFNLYAKDINKLVDISVEEITLTKSPAVGKMAEFTVIKNFNDSPNDENSISFFVPFQKSDSDKKQVAGYALVPYLPDYQGDIVEPSDVVKSAHVFLKNLIEGKRKGSGTGEEHADFDGIGYTIESYIDTEGVHGVKGGWYVTKQITDDDVWQKVKKGELKGFSIGGEGKRLPIENIDKAIAGIEKALNDKLKKSDNVDNIDNIDNDKESIDNSSIEIEKNLLTKIFNLFKSNKDSNINEDGLNQQSDTKGLKVVTDDKVNFEKGNSMDLLELCKKMDVTPSRIEELVEAGVDVEKAYENLTGFMKAIGMNLSEKGVGAATMNMISIVRSGEFGKFPQEMGTSIGKSEKPVEKVEKKEETNESKEAVLEEMKKHVEIIESLSKRIDSIEKKKGVKKSSSTIEYEDTEDEDENADYYDVEFPGDAFEVSLESSEKVAKRMGIRKPQ